MKLSSPDDDSVAVVRPLVAGSSQSTESLLPVSAEAPFQIGAESSDLTSIVQEPVAWTSNATECWPVYLSNRTVPLYAPIVLTRRSFSAPDALSDSTMKLSAPLLVMLAIGTWPLG